MSCMKKTFFCLGLVSSLAFASVALAAQHDTEHKSSQGNTQNAMPMPQGMMGAMANGGMMDGMMKGCMAQAAMNDAMRHDKTFSDKAFLSAMIPHHETAVAMADAVVKNGKDPQVKKWAKAVIDAQQKEIKTMRGWLAGMGGEDAQAAAAMRQSMQSMMAAPMNKDPDANFVSMMIGHHASAVEMAVGAVTASNNPDVIKLSDGIIRSQLKEITEYRAWLKARGM